MASTGSAVLAAVLAAAWLALAGGAGAEAPAVDAGHEIAALVDALPASGCRFQRNGSWYDGARAREHLLRKYDYLRRRGLAATSELFIARAASRSSISGKDYRVACPGEPEQPAEAWFRARLQRLRHHGASSALPLQSGFTRWMSLP